MGPRGFWTRRPLAASWFVIIFQSSYRFIINIPNLIPEPNKINHSLNHSSICFGHCLPCMTPRKILIFVVCDLARSIAAPSTRMCPDKFLLPLPRKGCVCGLGRVIVFAVRLTSHTRAPCVCTNSLVFVVWSLKSDFSAACITIISSYYTCQHSCTHTYIHTYTHTRTHIHTCTHTYTHICSSVKAHRCPCVWWHCWRRCGHAGHHVWRRVSVAVGKDMLVLTFLTKYLLTPPIERGSTRGSDSSYREG